MKKSKSKHWRWCIWIAMIIFLAIYITVDYFDIPSKLGLKVTFLNHDLLSIFVGAYIAVVIFILTYQYVEQKSIEKAENQLAISKMILKKTYDECDRYIKVLDIALGKLVAKTNFSAYYEHNSPAAKYADIPFEQEEIIRQFAIEGVINQSQLEEYYNIKQAYLGFITTSVIFYDHPEMVKPTKDELFGMIKQARENLNGR